MSTEVNPYGMGSQNFGNEVSRYSATGRSMNAIERKANLDRARAVAEYAVEQTKARLRREEISGLIRGNHELTHEVEVAAHHEPQSRANSEDMMNTWKRVELARYACRHDPLLNGEM